MVTCSSILARITPWTEEPAGYSLGVLAKSLQLCPVLCDPMGSHAHTCVTVP